MSKLCNVPLKIAYLPRAEREKAFQRPEDVIGVPKPEYAYLPCEKPRGHLDQDHLAYAAHGPIVFRSSYR